MYPSVGVVYAKSTSLSKSLRCAASKINSLRRTWTKKNSGDDEIVYESLENISAMVSRIHSDIENLSYIIGEEVEPETITVPETITLTLKEFMFLQNVFIDYTQCMIGEVDFNATDEPKIKSQ